MGTFSDYAISTQERARAAERWERAYGMGEAAAERGEGTDVCPLVNATGERHAWIMGHGSVATRRGLAAEGF